MCIHLVLLVKGPMCGFSYALEYIVDYNNLECLSSKSFYIFWGIKINNIFCVFNLPLMLRKENVSENHFNMWNHNNLRSTDCQDFGYKTNNYYESSSLPQTLFKIGNEYEIYTLFNGIRE